MVTDPLTEIELAAPVLAAPAALTVLDLLGVGELEAGLEVDAGEEAAGEAAVGLGTALEEAPFI